MSPKANPTPISLTLGIALAFAGALAASVDPAFAQDERRRLSSRDMEIGVDPKSAAAIEAEKKRLESIEFLKQLLAGDVEGDRKPEMMLRLADLYFQQGRSIYGREMQAFDEEVKRCEQDKACDPVKLFERGPVLTESAEWQQKAIRLYEQILRNYPRYARADEATYYLGMALQDTNQREPAVEQFTKLVKQYPESGYVADSYINIGEYFFDTNNAYKALLAYQKATAFRESEKYSFALYKLAWCYYNVGEYDKAVDTMKAVVSYTQTQGTAQKAIQLQDEALKDLVRFFADAGNMNEAYEYFNKLGKKDLIRDMLKRLANMYFEQGKFEQTIEMYRRLINEDPQAADAPTYQAEIIKASKKIGKKPEILVEVNRLRETYGKQSAWARANATNQDAVKNAEDEIEKNLRIVAIEYHDEARKLGTNANAKEAWALAEKAYATYLNEFPNAAQAYDVRYAYGELLYKVKKFDLAYDQYMLVVKTDPKGKHSQFCAESAIFAAEELIKVDGGANVNKTTGKVDKNIQPQELTANEKKLIDACSQYAKLYPGGKKTQNAIYKSGYLLYNKYRFSEAAEQFNLVIQMDPKSSEAEIAANLILDSFAIKEDYANLKKNAKFYYDQAGLGSEKFKNDVYGIYQRASFQLIVETLKADKDELKAAKSYEEFYQEFKDKADVEVLSTAINNAAVYYTNGKRVADSMRLRHLLVDDPKFGAKTKYYYGAIENLGFAYENIADFDEAAKFYEKLFSLYPAEKAKKAKEDAAAADKMTDLALDAIYSAAVFRRALGEVDASVANYNLFLKEAATSRPKDERIYDVKLTIGKIYEEAGLHQKAADAYYAFYSAKDAKDIPVTYTYFARLQHGKALTALGKGKDATALYTKTVDDYAKYIKGGGEVGAHTEYVAEMMYTLALPKVEAYMAMGIKSLKAGGRRAEDANMAKQLKNKQAELQNLDKLFKEIIGTKSGPWSLAALVQLGKVQENMSEVLLKGDLPYYLTEDQAEFYKLGMEDMAYPRTQAAVELYKLALDKAYELTLYNDDTAYATRRLGVLAPDDYPGLEESVLSPNYTSSKNRSYTFETEL